MVGAAAHEDGGGLGGGVRPGDLAHQLRVQSGDLRCPLGREPVELGPDVHEPGRHLDLVAAGQRDREGPVQRGVDPGGDPQPVERDRHGGSPSLVPHQVPVRRRVGGRAQVGLAQALAVVRPHQQRCVGVGAHEVPVEQVLLDDDRGERQREGGVGAGPDVEPVVGLGGGRRVDRVDHDQAGARGGGVEDEVGVGDAGLEQVGAHHQQEAAVGPVLGLVLGVLHAEGDGHAHRQVAVEVEAGAVCHAQQRRGAVVGALLDVARARNLAEHVDGVPAPALADGLHAVGHLVERLFPGGLAELAAAPRTRADERGRDAVLAVDQLVVGEALHAAPGAVGRVGVVGGLLDLDDALVAHERQLAARTGAVGRAGSVRACRNPSRAASAA